MNKRKQLDPDAVRSKMFVLQYLIEPSFESSVSWDVFDVVLENGASQTRLYRAELGVNLGTWAPDPPPQEMPPRSRRDPNAKFEWVLLDTQKFAAVLAQFRSVRIPLSPTGFNVGCDGTTYQLTFGDLFGNARISWWHELPREWKVLAPAVERLKELIESTWKRETPRTDR